MRHALMFAATLGIAAGALITAETARTVRTLQVHPGLPPIAIRILPAPEPASAGTSPHLIGRVEISRRGEAKPFQTLDVTGYGTGRLEEISRQRVPELDRTSG